MNKILMSKKKCSLELKNETYFLSNINNNSVLKVKVLNNVNSTLYLYLEDSKVDINIELLENSSLIINQLGINSSINYNCNLYNSSNLLCVDSIIASNESLNNIKLNHKGNSINTKFYTDGINLGSKLYFNIDGIIPKTSIDCNLDEISKVINLGSCDSKIIPNLIISTNEVVANHSAFIGTLNDEDINYLKSRGIDDKNIKMLLVKSNLLGKMNDNIKELFIEKLNLYKRGDYLE